MTTFVCDQCNKEEGSDFACAMSPSGGIPTDLAPNAVGPNKVARLLCLRCFLDTWKEIHHQTHNIPSSGAIDAAAEHLRLSGRL
jgi:hypothetical protein